MRKPSRMYLSIGGAPYKIAFLYYDIDGPKKTILEVYEFIAYRALLEWLVEKAIEINPDSLRVAQERDEGVWQESGRRKNLYISRNRDSLFIQSPHLTEDKSFQVGEYWINGNTGKEGVEMMCRLIASGMSVKVHKAKDFKI